MDAKEKIDAFKKAAAANRTNGGNVALKAVDFCWLVDQAAAEFDRQAAAEASAGEVDKAKQKAAAAEKRRRGKNPEGEAQAVESPAEPAADPNDPLAVAE